MSDQRYGFSKEHRLGKKKEIDQLFQAGKFEHVGFLNFRYLSQDAGHMKVVISISKRVGNAPKRNRIKRLVREALRLSRALKQHSVNCAIYVTKPPRNQPTLPRVQSYIEKFLASLPQ